MFKMNFCQSHIPGASLNRRLPAYETYRPRFDATREALCIACIDYLQTCYSHYFSLVLIPLLVGNQIVDALPLVYFARKVELNLDNCFQYMKARLLNKFCLIYIFIIWTRVFYWQLKHS